MNQSRPHWSYSAISQYLRCPLQYYFQRILGIPSRTTSSGLALGSAVHAGLAEYHRRLMERQETSPDAVTKAFRDDWQERETYETIQFRDGDSRDDCIAQGVHLLELYLKEPPPEQIVAVEHRFMAPLCNSRGEYIETPLVAITDLITGAEDGLRVQEFKTSGRAYSESDVTSSLQPTCYVHAVRECLGQESSVEYTVLVKTKTPKVQRLQTSRYAEDCGRLGDLVQSIQRAVDLGIFYPVECPMNCSTCSPTGDQPRHAARFVGNDATALRSRERAERRGSADRHPEKVQWNGSDDGRLRPSKRPKISPLTKNVPGYILGVHRRK